MPPEDCISERNKQFDGDEDTVNPVPIPQKYGGNGSDEF